MFIEKKKSGKRIKYYLAHSYREKGKPKKIRKYLGIDLDKNELEKKKSQSKKELLQLIKELNTEVFDFYLTNSQLKSLNKLSKDIKIVKLSKESFKQFTQDFIFNTNAIEGSTMLKQEVKEVLEEHPKTNNPEELETLGVEKAIKYIKKTKEDLSVKLILKIHRLCFEKTKSFAGKFRNVEVVIKNSSGEILHQGVLVKYLKEALNELVEWHDKNKNNFKPLVLAGIIHNQFEYIHPFQDGNGRVGRLLLNFILLKNAYPPINIFLEDREKYYRTLQEYQVSHNLQPTIDFLIKQYKKTLKKATTKSRNRKK